MKKLTVLFTLTLLLLTGLLPAGAKEYAVKDIPLVHLQDRTRYVSNPDNILSAQAVATMDSVLYALEQTTGIQTLVVAVTGIEGGDCFDFAYRLGQETGVGQKQRDNGLVILLSTDERCIQFATGYGLEGILPDAICKRIQNQKMLPYFKDDNWDAGMVAGIRAVNGYLDGSMENIGNEDGEDEEAMIIILLFVFFFGGSIGIALFMNWRNKRCPVCKKHKLQRISSRVVSASYGRKTEEVIYQCTHCGHLVTRRKQSDDENYRGGGGPFIGGMGGGFFGGSGGGGGFSGGSFGGGSFGGGGAGSRF